jgi:pyruvate/2-oxoglutarate dehydrogenase complex dihydrolipoamide acyltransferase (E2) component
VILDFKLPLISPHMSEARIECLHAAEGSVLKPGSKLLDLSVDLSTNFSQDCPPISFFRIIVRENVVLRELRVVPGQTCKIGEVIAVFSTAADEDLQPGAQRAVRLATAGIIHHGGMWTGSNL